MDRRDRSRSRATSAAASMAALAAAAAAGEDNGTMTPMDEDQKPPVASLAVGGAVAGGPSSPPPTPAVPVSARRGVGAVAAGGGGGPSCQAERCGADLTDARRYHKRHKVCEAHSKAPVVIVAGLRQRFCQQCSRFHELTEFDDIKRSCRKRLAGHNERRRKSTADPNGGGNGSDGWRHGDQDGRGHPGNPQLNNLQIR
ncbi:hypothetical protein PR202_gb20898 [Eleusine coracana subsp. coracana]|uniref:SBP-type domain-containing protein n=1 Tax=Eleusine coracana subsp. coracana TaxID=191504 RepID=A0AAV5FBP3_ELECO|nr:hypothetical protein QOZ80_7BG0599800 [Eleusine coracana subsp. coracana]GJN32391.1 hypothetical protein PR202_gb20898 [Eleusine coracana subsp. coracana]